MGIMQGKRRIIKEMGQEHSHGQAGYFRVICMRVAGKMINNMARELYYIISEIIMNIMQVNSQMVFSMERAHTHGPMDRYMKENTKMVYFTVMACFITKTVTNMKDISTISLGEYFFIVHTYLRQSISNMLYPRGL